MPKLKIASGKGPDIGEYLKDSKPVQMGEVPLDRIVSNPWQEIDTKGKSEIMITIKFPAEEYQKFKWITQQKRVSMSILIRNWANKFIEKNLQECLNQDDQDLYNLD